MEKKEKIKVKIKALLSKTTENGATEEEAINALAKAQELMKQYFVTENDLEDPFLGERCVLKSCEMYKGGYDMSIFYAELANLFDCQFYYYHREEIFFFGFEQDAELCVYFYSLITKSCLNEANLYKKSNDYEILKNHYHGRTLVSSFIKGFLLKIVQKMRYMYLNRKSTIPEGQGLVVIEKEERVSKAFEELNLKIKINSHKDLQYEELAFQRGLQKGEDFEITQGLDDHKKESIYQLAE